MGSLAYKENKITYFDGSGETVLLDFNDYLSNKSRVSMSRIEGQTHLTIPELLLELYHKEEQNGEDLVFPSFLINILLTKRLIGSAHPIKFLEYGSSKGQLSWHLAEILGALHDRSELVCAYDTIDLEWMDKIAGAARLPNLSFFAGDFGHLQLQENYFDIVLINGLANFSEPKQVILNALQLTTENALILCYSDTTPLLEDTFKLIFDQREEYEAFPTRVVLVAEKAACNWYELPKPNFQEAARSHLAEVKNLRRNTGICRKEIIGLIKKLEQDVQEAIKAEDWDLKLELLNEKEMIIDELCGNTDRNALQRFHSC